ATARNRCAALQAKGLLTQTTPAAQATEALDKLHAAGWQPESDFLADSHFGLYATTAVAVTYANSYSRSSVKDNLCGYSYAFSDAGGAPQAVSAAAGNQRSLAQLFGTGNGVPPTGGPNPTINLINNASVGGAVRDQVSTTASTGQVDYNVDGAVCL